MLHLFENGSLSLLQFFLVYVVGWRVTARTRLAGSPGNRGFTYGMIFAGATSVAVIIIRVTLGVWIHGPVVPSRLALSRRAK